MKRTFPLHDLGDDEFESLVREICREILGTGTIVFAKGKDGGRDACFNGVSQKFPSDKKPLTGKFIIQAKHTHNPTASCSDKEFSKILGGETPKIKKLIKDNEVDHYLVFTNRKKPATKTITLEKSFVSLGLKTTYILGTEQICEWLTSRPKIWETLGFDRFEKRFVFQTSDLIEVVSAFHDALKAKSVQLNGLPHFPYAPKPKKNKINRLSKPYYEYIQRDSLPHFSAIDAFLKNPRNESYRALYEDTAHEIKGKIITHASQFESFDEALTYISDHITEGQINLRERRRFASIFLHYMYFTCDIGQHAHTIKTS